MNSISKLKTYLTTPSKCFIPNCKARCCTNAPLPEKFLPNFEGRIQRKIYSAINIGLNDPRDTFNSIIYNTTRSPIQPIGVDQNHHLVLGIPKELIEQLNIKSMEEIDELVKSYNQYENYCPFITNYGKCSVYEHRPNICREFGSSPLKVDFCHDKSSRLDIAKFYLKEFIDVKGTFINMKNLIKEKFFQNKKF